RAPKANCFAGGAGQGTLGGAEIRGEASGHNAPERTKTPVLRTYEWLVRRLVDGVVIHSLKRLI
ncbi:MAG: hypothetical protein M0P69_13700, partial [Bacteroidales bacterium]|nr:hypothetical protein [Bacteroidales bacterium]